MNPVCDQPECMDPKRFIGGFPDTGHYDHEMNWVPHEFDETNHPSHSERVRLADHRKASDPEHCAKYGETLYHGTSKENADSIAKHGFHLDNVTNGRHSGHGVYLTRHKHEAHEYGTHVVEAKVDTSNFHDNPWYDEDVAHIHPDHISAALEHRGHHGHIDPDDGAHIVYNPAHVHVVKVHGPVQKTAAATTSDADGHLVNPVTGGKDWHHGTPHKFTDFGKDERTDEEWDEHEASREGAHWNTFLGTHWTSLHATAGKFARGLHQNTRTADQSDPGTIHTAHLGIASPAHFHSEEDMDSQAFEDHWHATQGNHDREDPHRYHDEVCEKPGCHHIAEHEGDDDVTEHVKGEYAHQPAKYLADHPYKEEIADDFRRKLQGQGHDGITYGNSHPGEGPVGHMCAITFNTSQIHNHRMAPGNVKTANGATHSVYRGLKMGGANFLNPVDIHDDDAVLAHLHKANETYKQWNSVDVEHPKSTPYGRHWTSDHEQARRFATDQIQNLTHRPPPHGQHDRYGVVLEAKTHVEPKHDDFMAGYGEKEIERPARSDIHSVVAHVHVLRGLHDSDGSKDAREKRSNTYVRSIPVPEHMWRTAALSA